MNDIDLVTPEVLKELLHADTKPCISIYVPGERTGREVQQAPIRLKNLVHEAERTLKAHGARWNLTEDLLGKAEKLIGQPAFWAHPAAGLAYFSRPGFLRVYRLPIRVPEAVTVNERFQVTPLLPILMDDGRFYILSLSEKHTQLFEATKFTIRPVRVPHMPKSMAEALWADDHSKQMQRRSAGPTPVKGGAGASVAYNSGSGVDMERRKVDLKRYFDILEEALMPFWNRHPAPVVLAGVEYELPIFRHACNWHQVLPQELHGSFERASLKDLHHRAWGMVRSYFHQVEQADLKRFGNLSQTVKTSDNPDQIKKASAEGRVETLFLRRTEALTDENGSGLSEEFNDLAVSVLGQSGKVYILEPKEMPIEGSAAAILRY